jgi:hypothetical protein
MGDIRQSPSGPFLPIGGVAASGAVNGVAGNLASSPQDITFSAAALVKGRVSGVATAVISNATGGAVVISATPLVAGATAGAAVTQGIPNNQSASFPLPFTAALPGPTGAVNIGVRVAGATGPGYSVGAFYINVTDP